MAGTVVVTGHRELDKQFRELGPALSKKFARQALRKAGKRVQDRAKAAIEASPSIDTGALLKGIKVRAMKRSRKRIGIVIMTTAGQHKSEAFNGQWLEYGTDTMPAEPFLRPSLYDSASQIQSDFVTDVNEVISEAARKAKVL